MSKRARWWLGTLLVSAELLVVLSLVLNGEARKAARTVYVTTWRWVSPDVPPPDRFLAK